MRRAGRWSRTFRIPTFLDYFVEAGFEADVAAARAASTRGDERALLAAISDRFLDETCLIGSREEVREQAEAWRALGITHMVIGAVPVPGGGDPIHNVLATLGES